MRERNFRVHIVAAIAVFVFSYIYGIDKTQFLVIALTVFSVMAAEMFNTAIETVVDLISPQKSRLAKIAKDTAAGAVLLSAICAVVIAVVMFSDLRKLAYVLSVLLSMPNLIFVCLFIAAALIFVFGIRNKK